MARSNSLQLKACLLKKALIFSAFFYVLVLETAQATSCPPQHIDETARVNYVYDGDTLQLEDGRKVRLMGIDTPEVYNRHKTLDEDIRLNGEKAKSALQQQLALSKQHIGLAFGPQQFDRYGRTLAHVFLPDGKNLQAWLIEQGYAIAFTTPPNDEMSSCYRQQEVLAIKHKRGIWKSPRYQLKTVSQLNENSDGFHRLQGTVTRVWQAKFKLTLFLDDKLEIIIRRYDLSNFNVHMLNNLLHKKIQIRGWLHSKKTQQNTQTKTRFTLALRHPDAIKVLH